MSNGNSLVGGQFSKVFAHVYFADKSRSFSHMFFFELSSIEFWMFSTNHTHIFVERSLFWYQQMIFHDRLHQQTRWHVDRPSRWHWEGFATLETIHGGKICDVEGVESEARNSYWTLVFHKTTERMSGWRIEIFLVFTPTWGNDPNWLIFFNWVETTNQDVFFFTRFSMRDFCCCQKWLCFPQFVAAEESQWDVGGSSGKSVGFGYQPQRIQLEGHWKNGPGNLI